ncbi:MAG: permease-like cell division protein FtsX [Bacteroidales bacterium]|jgi:cell division transport system permease protein|nr:permease-like cell division protein FtsX [Bacteroidales bacterium]MDD2263581.1 permease-like cell division protein FtsX [Bacteroidales bacterium]MDD2830628.1 permease-like cell division protein FtsX [Bacteroidales bacterium]MDD3208897.1 permease-like cell division protein FtsX [Bacteroidales bacterium]MDD3697378.1 permease-like cell division protein FtsX [Bacteroidales bacterium]
MAQQEKNIISQQLIQSYLSSVISISLVLLLTGMTGLLAVNARTVSDYFKEHLGVSVILEQETSDADSTLIVKQMLATEYVREAVRNAVFISREQGAGEMAQLLGPDFLDVFEYNPLPASVELRLKADYVHNDSIARMETYLSKLPFVEEVSYQAPLISLINRNLRNIGTVLGVIILILIIISFALIHNTIRLSVYARRFTIYTMRLVGATKRFIRKPFMIQAFIQGFISSLIAVLLLMGVIYLLQREFPGILMLITPNMFLIIIGTMIIIGVLLCRISTFFIVNRVVKLKASAFYY